MNNGRCRICGWKYSKRKRPSQCPMCGLPKPVDPFSGERFRLVNRESGSGDQTPPRSHSIEPPIVFIVPEPREGDTRERNAFGILKGFGKAYAAYYAARDNPGTA